MTRRILKIFHILGAIGMTGALVAYMILLATAPNGSLEDYALVRAQIETLSSWMLVPSLAIVLLSGIFAMATYHPFQKAGWVWAKAAMGFPMFEGTLVTIDGAAQRGAAIAQKAVAGEIPPEAVASLVEGEWIALWVILALSVAQTVVGVWRPRKRRGAGRAKAKAR